MNDHSPDKGGAPPGRVVVVGSVNADLVLRCSTLPLPGQTVHGRDFQILPGGKGANQAVAAARLGASVSFIGCVGDDDFGRTARKSLIDEGIDAEHLHTTAMAGTGVAMILVDDSGQNCITLAAGANGALSVAHVDAAASLLTGASLLISQLETPLAVVRHAIALAHATGVPVLLNPAPAQPLPPELLAQVDTLVLNETEAAVLLGLAPGTSLDAADAAARLRALGPRIVVLTLGAHGAQIASGDVCLHQQAPQVSVVDTTGAGDTFIGAYAAATCKQADLVAAVQYAQRAAALSVTKMGAIAGMPHQDEMHSSASGQP